MKAKLYLEVVYNDQSVTISYTHVRRDGMTAKQGRRNVKIARPELTEEATRVLLDAVASSVVAQRDELPF